MIIFLLLATLLSQRTGALPISVDASTVPTIVHDAVFGVFARSGSSCSDVRSMQEIVRSCLVTILACVYRAIHPNILDPDASFGTKLRMKLKIIIYALIAPEMMIWWALRQRIGAGIVVKTINAVRPELKWTQTHGHFVQMGGFRRKDDKEVIYIYTLLHLLRDNRLDIEELQLTEKEINAESKGTILSKALAAFQTTWFAVQCLARLQQGLPIIELEVITLAFATLNAITYGLWWYKPLNVVSPIYLHIHPIPTPESPPQECPSSVRLEEKPLLGGDQSAELGQTKKGNLAKGKDMARGVVTAIRDAVKGAAGGFKQDLSSRGLPQTAWTWLIKKPFVAIAGPLYELYTDTDVNAKGNQIPTFYAVEIPKKEFSWVITLSSVIGMIFGGIHFLSWSSTFPTHVLLVLWRTSSVIMVAQPFLILLLGICDSIQNRALSGSRRYHTAERFRLWFTLISFVAGTVPYILARFCVLVLAFLTLRDIPLGAFTIVSWTAYIPHF